MSSADQVVFVLQVVLTLGPLAVYFLGLGLVNSKAHPCLVNCRVDYVLLAIAVVPVVLGPVVMLVEHGFGWLALIVVVGVAAGLFGMLPGREAGWVVYNIDPHRCRQLLEQACRRLGWATQCEGDQLHVLPVDLIISQNALSWLRNVSIHITPSTGRGGRLAREQLVEAFSHEIEQESMLPSPTGASLVVIGAALLGLPMWYLFNHMEAIVDVVRDLLMA